MRNLLKAEWKKVRHNYKTVSFIVWIVPVGVFTMLLMGILLAIFSASERGAGGLFAVVSTNNWIVDLTGIFNIVLVFPTDIMGRVMPLAFIGLSMAGEYQWDTWKSIVPRGSRISLLMSKIGMSAVVMLTSLVLTCLITFLGSLAGRSILGLEYLPALTAENLTLLGKEFAINFGLATLVLIFLSSLGALIARFSRSTLITFLGGFFFTIVDGLLDKFLYLFGRIFNLPQLVNGYAYGFSFNLGNTLSWLKTESQFPVNTPGFEGEYSLWFSVLVLALWIGGMLILALWSFNRQDLTSS
jgi:ABC-type transport system involved in multi-copper enzyme maturation permease subunit